MNRAVVAFVAGSSAVLAACGSSVAEPQPTGVPSISVRNCGVQLSLSHPAQRAVTLEQGATETLLALGVTSQIAGTSHLKEAVRDDLRSAYDSIPVLAKEVATAEQIRAVDADLIYSPFASNYTREKSGDRQEWIALGVAPFTANADCREDPDNKGKDGFELIEKDLDQLGTLLGAAQAADKLIANQRAAVDEARKLAATRSTQQTTLAVLYSYYDGAPYVAGGRSIAQDMARLNGATNAFADIDQDWPAISWEAFAEKDPDYIVLADLTGRGAPGDTAQEKIAELKKNPATRIMTAVRQERYIIVPAVGFTQSVRSIEPLKLITQRLSADAKNPR